MTTKLHILKVGGAHLAEPAYLDALAAHIRGLARGQDERVILVHGGGKEIGSLHDRLGIAFGKKLGLRVTNDETMDLVTMVLSGLVNKRLVAHFQNFGLSALGLSGADLGVLKAEPLNRRQLGRVGGPPSVNVAKIRDLIAVAPLLVVAPVCLGPEGDLLNVNADVAAQALAVALDARRLDFVTDVKGVRTEAGSVPSLSPSEVESLINDSIVAGGMIPKLQASLAALDGGVDVVRVGNLESLAEGTATELHS